MTRTITIPSINCLLDTFTRLDDELGVVMSVSTITDSAEKWTEQIMFLAISQGTATVNSCHVGFRMLSDHQERPSVSRSCRFNLSDVQMSDDLLQRRPSVRNGSPKAIFHQEGWNLMTILTNGHQTWALENYHMCHLNVFDSNCCLIVKYGLNTLSSLSQLQNRLQIWYVFAVKVATRNSSTEHPNDLRKHLFTKTRHYGYLASGL